MIKYIKSTKNTYMLIFSICIMALITSGCVHEEYDSIRDIPQSQNINSRKAISNSSNNSKHKMVNIDVGLEENSGKMVTYDVSYTGRQNPFMPSNEMTEYINARQSAIQEANRRNAEIIRIKKLQNTKIREQDDISPYDFNLPVPPTVSGPADSPASRITKTKVVGIMYNAKSPSAIINVDSKDYLVRTGDKIIGQEYIVTKITQTSVSATMGANVYSAAIGEQFSKDNLEKNQTDIYDLKNRFGGRKI